MRLKIFRRTDLYILANMVLQATILFGCLFVWYKGVYLGHSDFLNTIQEGGSRLLLFVAGVSAIVFLNSLLIIYPRSLSQREDQSAMSKQTIDLTKQATTDPLTGLHNRRYFEDALRDYLVEFNKVGSNIGLLILDLDHFKSVNDSYGHDVGDVVLKEVALRMRAIAREHDVIARLGGEEFAVITPYLSMDKLMKVADRYREMVQELKIRHEGITIRPTISIGVATSEYGYERPDDLFKAADKKLYEAKNNGRNRVAA